MKLILLTAIISLLSGCVSVRLSDGKVQVCADMPMPEEIEIETDSTK